MANDNELQVRNERAPQPTDAQELHQLPVVAPLVDILENRDGYILRADVPGVTPKDVDIHFDRGELTVQARREHPRIEGRGGSEFGSVMFKRAFKFPEAVDGAKIEAELKAGVLELRLPKSPEVRPRRIEIQAG